MLISSNNDFCLQGPKNGWYDGTAIGVAVVLVICVTGKFWSFHSMIQLGPFNLNLEVFPADLFCICSDLIWLSLVIESMSCERVSLSKGFDWAPKGISLYTNM